MIGSILRQRYKIIKELELEKGGFGETYLAEDLDIPVTPKPVCVVKRLKPTEIDRDSIRLFEQEARILYQLGQNHDQIPKLYAHFQEGEDFYLIQEFIEGKDLTNEISPGKKLSECDVIQLLRDVLEILVYVHDNKVIHRDIKPDNIMRRKDGKLVLIDFGAIKQINTTIAMKSGSTTRTIRIGTPGYTPLEQAMGRPKFSSDIYALGMMAIQALIDLSPRLLPEDDDGEILWIDQVEISDKLEQVISKMVRYDWRERYINANEALEELDQLFGFVKLQNESSEDWFEEGNQLFDLEKYEEAITSYDKAIAIKPDYHEAWYNWGFSLENLQKYKEAIASYNKAIAIKPDDHEVWINRGNSLAKLQEYRKAIASYDKAIAIKPDYHEAWYNRGFFLQNLQKYEEAIASYDKAIAIKPDSHEAWNNRGNCLDELEKYEEAIASFDKAIAIKPDCHKAWNNRGNYLANLQKYEEALKCYEKAISIQPDYQPTINNRNKLLNQLGRLN
ncbi:tetratricopeptide repeat protein [Anabaena azotica]|uniref:tetratricopeptide repeat protein n=1 Tax=Anabaena azotica TaxID=197653 RepID=UPI0039A57C08